MTFYCFTTVCVCAYASTVVKSVPVNYFHNVCASCIVRV